MTTSKTIDRPDQPIQDFTQCHVGILSKLDMLGELPDLLAPAARARDIADKAVEFFRGAIFEHHLDEERELFPAVLEHAEKGAERDKIQDMVTQLTDQHREMEAIWKRLEAGLKKVAKGKSANVSVSDIEILVANYHAHAQLEETQFLPLAQSILERNANHIASLGMALHMRHLVLPVTNYV